MAKTLKMVCGAYESKSGFRPVVRLAADGRMRGNKASPHLFPSRDAAMEFARKAAADVAESIRAQFPECACIAV